MSSRSVFLGSALWLIASIAFGSALTDAVKSGDRVTIARLLRQHAAVNEAESDGSTPLHWAARNGDLETVRALLKAGANASAANRLGVTPLSIAASDRDAAVATELIQAGADPNATLKDGETVLMTAARTGEAHILELLLKHGAKLDTRGPQFGESALMLAAQENQAASVRTLVQHGAIVDERSKPLTYNKDRFGLEGVLTILPHGGWTPLMYAARQGSLDAIAALLDLGAKPNLADPDGTTALILATINGHFDAAKLLVERGADVNQADSPGMTPLYAAVDMNTLGEVFGQPPRTPSSSISGIDLMKFLLARGANANARLTSSTLQRAHTPGEPTLGDGATALMRAAKNGDAEAMELLIANGADVNQAAKNGTTPLMFAMGLGRGVSAFAKDYATEADLLAGARVLVAHGANVNAQSVAGLTPVHYAAQAADANFPQPTDSLLDFLLAHGAKVNVADKQGRTPVDMAMGKGLRGRAGGPVKPREATAAKLEKLIAAAN